MSLTITDFEFFSPVDTMPCKNSTIKNCKNDARWTCSIGTGCDKSADNSETCLEYVRAGVDSSHSK